jgi:hypothetical protein
MCGIEYTSRAISIPSSDRHAESVVFMTADVICDRPSRSEDRARFGNRTTGTSPKL